MTLYIDPRSAGVPETREQGRFVDAQAIPIGGYYNVINTLNVIEPGKFETRIKTMFTSFSPLNDPRRENPASNISETPVEKALQQEGSIEESTINSIEQSTSPTIRNLLNRSRNRG